MKCTVAFLILGFNLIYTESKYVIENTAWGYLERYGIPEAERIRKVEEEYLSKQRIVGGATAELGQFVHQAGLLSSIYGLAGVGVCGGSLISNNRVITASHCRYDGVHQAWNFEIVLGSVTLFSGGTRLQSSTVIMHPNWSPVLANNDIAVIYLASNVPFSDTIGPIVLPSEDDINEDFAGFTATVAGFGQTYDGAAISINQPLSHISLEVIDNSVCSAAFPLVIRSSNICTSGSGGIGPCRGDSGGPLMVNRDDRFILIGIASFVSGLGCQAGLPAAYTRVTSFLPFISNHI